MHRDYALHVPRHSPLSLVAEVDVASSARGLLSGAERAPHGYRTGDALVFTDPCVVRLDPVRRELTVIKLMPGVTRAAVAEATGFAVTFAPDCDHVALPVPDALIAGIPRADRALIDRLLGEG